MNAYYPGVYGGMPEWCAGLVLSLAIGMFLFSYLAFMCGVEMHRRKIVRRIVKCEAIPSQAKWELVDWIMSL